MQNGERRNSEGSIVEMQEPHYRIESFRTILQLLNSCNSFRFYPTRLTIRVYRSASILINRRASCSASTGSRSYAVLMASLSQSDNAGSSRTSLRFIYNFQLTSGFRGTLLGVTTGPTDQWSPQRTRGLQKRRSPRRNQPVRCRVSNIKNADTNRNRNPDRREHVGSPFHLL